MLEVTEAFYLQEHNFLYEDFNPLRPQQNDFHSLNNTLEKILFNEESFLCSDPNFIGIS